MTAKAIMRPTARIPADAYAKATRYLSDTLEWLALWQDNAGSNHRIDDDFSAKQD
jgi:hypothetical protein